MLDNIFNQKEYGAEAKAMSSEFFVNVYTYMFIALGVSGTIAYLAGTSGLSIDLFIKTENGIRIGVTPVFYLVAFSPLLIGIAIQWMYHRISLPILLILFGIYSVLMGLSLSTIFLVYDLGSIISTFFVTAGAFAAMAVIGYTTKVDLTRFGSLLYMLFIGMILATVINLFMGSEQMDFIISIIGVFVFTGLTAYHMQNLKYIGEDPNLSHMDRRKLSLIGGLTLYILFVNLFLTLLRLIGNRE